MSCVKSRPSTRHSRIAWLPPKYWRAGAQGGYFYFQSNLFEMAQVLESKMFFLFLSARIRFNLRESVFYLVCVVSFFSLFLRPLY
jgi:hypothetical protein